MEKSQTVREQIETRLKRGASPKELIAKGFKRSTVYRVARRMKPGLEERFVRLDRKIDKVLESLLYALHSLSPPSDEVKVSCPMCGQDDLHYREAKLKGTMIWTGFYECLRCGYSTLHEPIEKRTTRSL